MSAISPAELTGGEPAPRIISLRNVRWSTMIGITLIHLIALLAVIPGLAGYLFTWEALILAIVLKFMIGTLGINIGYHRLITHKGFHCPKWFERTLAVLGALNLQGGPISWIGDHRVHHADSDHDGDPHSPHTPIRNFLWGHVGWLLFQHPEHNEEISRKFAKDLTRERFYIWLERLFALVYLAHAALVGAIGWLVGTLVGGPDQAMRYALSFVVWSVAVRTVYLWHVTWLVNSAAHMWGSRMYESKDKSRNNWWVALLTDGEGWHNNHHAQPRSAAHGHASHQLDVSFWIICLFEKMGLVWDVVRPRRGAPAEA